MILTKILYQLLVYLKSTPQSLLTFKNLKNEQTISRTAFYFNNFFTSFLIIAIAVSVGDIDFE